MSIILIGFMGTGKSTVGKILAEQNNQSFCDLDELIEEKAGMSIPNYFEKYGEPAFRKLEQQLLKEAINSYQVLSTGGGTPTIDKNKELLQSADAIKIKLEANIDEIRLRIGDDQNRPIFKQLTHQEFNQLKEKRETIYNESCDIIIDTNQKTPQMIADEIMTNVLIKQN